MIKKGISLILTATIFLFVFSGTTNAASSGQIPLRPTTTSDYGILSVHIKDPNVNRIGLTVDQQGIHIGQQAHTYWKVSHALTGVEFTKDIPGDFYGAILISNLKQPGGNYEVQWNSRTNNDTEGFYQTNTPSTYAEFVRIR